LPAELIIDLNRRRNLREAKGDIYPPIRRVRGNGYTERSLLIILWGGNREVLPLIIDRRGTPIAIITLIGPEEMEIVSPQAKDGVRE